MRKLAFLLLLLPLALHAGKKPEKFFLFGYGTHLADSVVYLSPVMAVEGTHLDDRTKFLADREAYGRQLQNYLEALYVPHATCVVFYANTREKAEKKYLKIRKEARKRAGQTVVQLEVGEFSFTPIKH